MQSIKFRIEAQLNIQLPTAPIFEVISNHPTTPKWVEAVKAVKILKEGAPKHGKGTIREVVFRPRLWPSLKEEIVEFHPNKSYNYKIREGMPGLIDHTGVWKVEEVTPERSLVSWTIDFEFKKWHWFSIFILNNFKKSFAQVQEEALQKLKEQLESELMSR